MRYEAFDLEPKVQFHVFHLLMPLTMALLTYKYEQIYQVKESYLSKMIKLIFVAVFYTVYGIAYFKDEDHDLIVFTLILLTVVGFFCLTVNVIIFTRIGKWLGLTRN